MGSLGIPVCEHRSRRTDVACLGHLKHLSVSPAIDCMSVEDDVVSRMLMTGVLLVQLIFADSTWAETRWIEGAYRNPALGFSVRIPRGLRGKTGHQDGLGRCDEREACSSRMIRKASLEHIVSCYVRGAISDGRPYRDPLGPMICSVTCTS